MKRVLAFLEDLAKNNNREWFAANKERYTEALGLFTQFAEEYLVRLQQIDENLTGVNLKDCMWRIYRDTRFSKDKTPYKDHFGVFPAAGQPGKPQTAGKHSDRAGYYLHIQPGHCMFAAGMWCPVPDLLNAVRRELQANYEEVEEIMAAEPFQKYFGDFDQTYMLKRVPAGYDADFPHPDWLKQKWFVISTPFSDADVCKPKFMDKLLDVSRAAKPMNDFLNYTFEEYGEFPDRERR
ncbi:MAG: DUF2461 domain-containing protein [Paludibacteraceae bacterium]|nr:DUF2461 domain-containing protein [Paludibacteraceae bacterium]MBR0309250.1 DUF2461 domain-containing protein [Paludibacteraceae bacterium]